ncbi:hypothetical protein P43SY_001172 [Pythium insidiosum]|uniref:Uncharacterized protein n=1 Tax=Pythium insidiosum TaxID=114742 RepID=A0AAD5LYU0_PYTIN|nr:hypothetical protein P43SY_001172 [Pythium insidiosum]
MPRRLLTLLLVATVATVSSQTQTSPPFPSDTPEPPKIPPSMANGAAIVASPVPTTAAVPPPLALANAPMTPAPTTKAPVATTKAPVATTKAPVATTKAPAKTTKALESLETIPSLQSAGALAASSSSDADADVKPPTKQPKPKSKAPAKTASAASSDAEIPELSGACVCNRLRRVSLMGAADYCLPAVAATGDKCGNVVLAERGECPRAGAQPCQDTGHVLSNDSICAYDKRQDVYKCVASKDDLDIQINGKRRRPRRSTNGSTAGAGVGPDAAEESASSQRRASWSLAVATLVTGVAAVALVM